MLTGRNLLIPARGSRRRPTRFVVLRALAAAAMVAGSLSVASELALTDAAAATTPGSPGTPQPGTPFFEESFSNQSAAAAPIGITAYAGGSAAQNETYTADPNWRETAKICNGWILSSLSPAPTTALDASCQTGPWPGLQGLADFLGQYQGMTGAASAANQVLSEYTHGADPGPGVELETKAPMTAQAGHYYAVSALYAATNCNAPGGPLTDPSLTFSLLINGTPRVLASGLDPCTAPGRKTYTGTYGSSAITGTVAELQSAAIQLPTSGSPTLGVRLFNASGAAAGNDSAFDRPRIVDVTPQLDKSFSPSTIAAGGTSTATFTITNTSDLQAKNGFTFDDNLPAGVKVAAPNAASTTCPAGVVTAPTGGTKISVTGNLDLGMASCTVSVDVTAASAGTYTNGPTNITSNGGLNPPGNAVLTVVDTDFGDAPASYGTATASHTETPGLRIGTVRDAEVAAQSSAGATGDDTSGADDEDGITGTPVFRTDQTMSEPVTVTNTTGAAATLVGWIDLNRDGDFNDPGEQSAPVAVPSGADSASLSWPGSAGAASGSSFLRLRLYPGTPGTVSPTAPTTGGEIEDHPVTLAQPAIKLTKTASPINDLDGNGADAGDTIVYSLVVSNTGTLALDPVSVTDPLLGGPVPCGSGPLAAGGTRSCPPVTYTLTQADIDAGGRGNTATVTGTPPTGPPVTDTASTLTPVSSTTGVSLQKTVDRTELAAGQTATYTMTATNTGTVTLTQVRIQEGAFTGSGAMSGLSCTPGQPATLKPGESLACTATYTVTQADVDRGSVANTASVSGTPPSGPPVTDTDNATVPSNPKPVLGLNKRVGSMVDTDHNGITDAGDQIDYVFDLTNSGNVTLSALGVHDQLLTTAGITVTCDPTAVAPGATATCTADQPYVITQADVDTGAVHNTATATGTPPGGSPVTSPPDETITPADQAPGITLQKSVDRTELVAGQSATYTMTATNTGDVTLSGVRINEGSFTGSGAMSALDCTPAQPATLKPGAALVCTAAYTVTQTDVDRGSLVNTASTSGNPPSGASVTDTDGATIPSNPQPALALDKRVSSVVDVNGNQITDAGDRISYAFDLTNSGNVTLTDLGVADDLLKGAGTTVTCAPSTLAPGASVTCTADQPYVITQADVDAGAVHNTATATGTPPGGGGAVTSPPDETITPTDQVAHLGLDKRVDRVVDVDGDGRTDAGDTIYYAFDLTNTGDVTLTDLSVSDALLTSSGISVTCDPSTLAPAATVTCAADEPYVITQADVDSGSVRNTATASGTPPGGAAVTSTPDQTATPADQVPGVALVKSVDRNQLVAGQTATYTMTATNTGDVTLTGVKIAEDSFTGSGSVSGLSCTPSQPATLKPRATLVCTATYTVTQADVDRGSITNSASVSGAPPSGPPVTDTDGATMPSHPAPALTVDKRVSSIADVNQNQATDVGDQISYAFDLTNTGNVTLTDLAVADDLLTSAGISATCDPSTLAPGATVTCTADQPYVVTQADVDTGAVRNTATATGTPPSGPPVTSPPDETITPADQTPAIVLQKSVDRTELVAGQTVTYTMTATNTGDVTLSGVRISEGAFTGSGTMSALDCTPSQPATLPPGAAAVCTATYSVTQADVDRGSLANTAAVTGTPPSGPAVTDTDDATVPSNPAPALGLDKRVSSVVDVNHNQFTDVGDQITYAFDLTNNGTVTLTDLSIDDDLLKTAGIAATCTQSTLAPGATTTCTADQPYVITQADVDTGAVHNTATATAASPSGPPTTSPPDETLTPTDQDPAVHMTKRVDHIADADGDGETDLGDQIFYAFDVTNTGNTTLDQLTVVDALLASRHITVSCPVSSLLPGAKVTCAADDPYVITQSDVEAGRVVNTALVRVTDPSHHHHTGTGIVTTTLASCVPSGHGRTVLCPLAPSGKLPATGMPGNVLAAGLAGLSLVGLGSWLVFGATRRRQVRA